MTMKNAIAVLNSGSSSVKFQIFKEDKNLTKMYSGLAERLGEQAPFIKIKNAKGETLCEETLPAKSNHGDALKFIFSLLEKELAKINTRLIHVGHRFVHGGDTYIAPVKVNSEVLIGLKEVIPLAPLHNPHHIKGIEYLLENYPRMQQVVCFDTAFHATNPESFRTFALPRKFWDMGIKRYGFHGLSYEYIAHKMAEVAPQAKRIVACHLGNGASMCAINNGKSVTSTMGFTALEGLPMGTRCGNLDPSVPIHMVEKLGMTIAEVNHVLNKESGLLGLSGMSNDVRDIQDSKAKLPKMAMEYYTMTIARKVGDLATAIGGLDAIVFTAGVGENSTVVRKMVAEKLAWLGIELDEKANDVHSELKVISKPTSSVDLYTVPTNEELMIAKSSLNLLKK